MKRVISAFLVTLGLSASAASAQVGPGYGVLGDSWSAEYRADAAKGGAYAATTFNWMELLAKYRSVNFGPWGTYPFPRLSGYAYNWAASGATTTDVLNEGQASGVAQQVTAGSVGRVVLMIGVNDLVPAMTGAVGVSGVQALAKTATANIAKAMDIVLHAGPVNLLVVTLPPVPAAYGLPPAVALATSAINAGIQSAAAARGVLVVDVFTLEQAEIFSKLDTNGNLTVGGQTINFYVPGDEPHHALLADSHPGTVYNGLIANMIIGVLNLTGSNIAPFTEQEILQNAGISTKVPPPPPETKMPAAFQMLTGVVQSGTLQSLAANDNQYLTVASSGTISQTAVQFVSVTSPTRLDVTVRVKSSRSNTTVTIAAYDFTKSAWHTLTTATVSSSEVALSPALTGNLTPYLSNGMVGLSVKSQASGSHTLSLDQAQIVVTH